MVTSCGGSALLKLGYHRFLGASKSFDQLEITSSNGFEKAENNIPILNKKMTTSEMEKAVAEAVKIKKSLDILNNFTEPFPNLKF